MHKNAYYQLATRSIALAQSIKPLLAGKGPEAQGAALADLVATWLAGHHPDLRQEIFREWQDAVSRLVPVNEKIIFGDAGFPTGGVR